MVRWCHGAGDREECDGECDNSDFADAGGEWSGEYMSGVSCRDGQTASSLVSPRSHPPRLAEIEARRFGAVLPRHGCSVPANESASDEGTVWVYVFGIGGTYAW